MADPTISELAKNLGDTQTALNIVWTMVAGFLVMFMQAGFALVETGLTRAKNAAHTMAMNFLVYSIGIIAYYFVGFGLQMGGVGAVFGGDHLAVFLQHQRVSKIGTPVTLLGARYKWFY